MPLPHLFTVRLEIDEAESSCRATIEEVDDLIWINGTVPDVLADVAYGIEEIIAETGEGSSLNRAELYRPMSRDPKWT